MAFAPTHVSHKQVEAYPLDHFDPYPEGTLKAVVWVGDTLQHIDVPPDITARAMPEPGDMLVRYAPTENEPDGYLAFSPRAAFDAGYQALRELPSRLTPADVQSVIVSESYHRLPGTTFMVCFLILRNGYVVTGESACADPELYDQATGEKYARENAVAKIWNLEGYLLRQRRFDLAPTA